MHTINTTLIEKDTLIIAIVCLAAIIALSTYYFISYKRERWNPEVLPAWDDINAPKFFDDDFTDYRNLVPSNTVTYVHDEFGVALYGFRPPTGFYHVHPEGVKVISEDFAHPVNDIFRMPVEQLEREYTAY